MTRLRPLLLVALSIAVLAHPACVRAQALVADLSEHLVAITTGFTGKEVLLFGATEGEGDVVVTVFGPESPATVWRKERVAGIWMNTESVEFASVPSYYASATSRPIEEIGTPGMRARLQIGLEHIRLAPVSADTDPARLKAFRAALLRTKERQGLYRAGAGTITQLGDRLFQTRLYLPSNVHTGTYRVNVLRIVGDQIIGAQTTPLIVSKIGIGAEVFDFAYSQGAIYGLIAVALAVVAGWLAGVIFRKV